MPHRQHRTQRPLNADQKYHEAPGRSCLRTAGQSLLLLMVALGTAVISPDGLAQSIEKTGSANGQLDKLPASVSHDIKTICLPVQYKSGATAYRECVSSEVTRYEQKNAVETVTPQTITKQADTASLIPESKPEPKSLKPAAPLSFDSLAHDDKYAIQRTRRLHELPRRGNDCTQQNSITRTKQRQ